MRFSSMRVRLQKTKNQNLNESIVKDQTFGLKMKHVHRG